MIKKIIIFLFLFSSVAAFAATRTVTSSADSGSGSLRDIIDNVANAGDSIVFANSISTITLTSGDIQIDLNISIDGGGDVEIDGNANSRIFNINGNNVLIVSIQNLTFKNGSENSGNGGGAIYNRNENVTVSNCVFTGNSFTRSWGQRGGGAIYNYNGLINLIDCTITNNSASGSGNDGGGIFAGRNADSQFFVDNCLIKDNSAVGDGGGVFTQNGFLSITNNTEISDNEASDDGGGICINSVNVNFFIDENINFNNNSAGDNGGAYFSNGDLDIVFTNCNFIGNSSEDRGGAICANNSTKIKIYNSLFTNNFSNSDSGGAFYNNLTSSTALVYKCEFKNNYSPNYGGAIYHNGFMEIVDSVFYSNAATNRGGGAYIRRTKILDTDFTNNITVRVNTDGGGALYTLGDSSVSNCNFFGNSANGNAGAFRINSAAAKVNLLNCEFKNNSAKNGGGGGIQAYAAAALTIKNSRFFNNNATTDGGAVWAYQNYMSVLITNSVFDGNNANDDGGTLYIAGTSSVINCSLTKSYAGDLGGAIGCLANVSIGKIIGCNFQANTAIDRGGAAFIQGNWTIDNSSVISNSATIDGGGFYFGGAAASTINVFNCNLFLNSAGDDGGGIYANCVLNSTNCIINSNVSADNGGGIDSELKFTLENSKIINNYAADTGGGIYDNAPDASFTSLIHNCYISTNVAFNSNGGGICQNNSTIIFDNSIILSNYSGNYGGGIYANANNRAISIFTNCTVNNNYSVEDGGGIRSDGFLLIYGSCFAHNECQNDDGGGIYKINRSGKIINSTVSDNSSSDNGGGIYLSANGKLDIYNSTIANNSSVSGGIYKDGTSSGNNIINIFSSISSGNSATDIAGNINIISNSIYQTVGAGTWTTSANNLQTNPLLRTLANYGGITETHGLNFQSPAINSGVNPLNLDYDQRATPFQRVVDSATDIGAYEVSLVKCSLTGTPTNGHASLNVNFSSSIIGTNSSGVYYFWDFDNDGSYETNGLNLDSPAYTYNSAGLYSVKLLVSNQLSEIAEVVNTNYVDVMAALTRYVAPNGGHVSPFVNWADAATNIQAAVDVSSDDYLIIVSNGAYFLSQQIVITNRIYMESYMGPNKTLIVGTSVSRCIYATEGANISGFTFSNGHATTTAQTPGINGYGGGAYCDGSVFITNCIFVDNYAQTRGGGAYCLSGTIILNSLFNNNNSDWRGAGVFCDNGGIVQNSIMQNNIVNNYGGGICLYQGGFVSNCIMRSNDASGGAGTGGGGAECYEGGEIHACEIYENTSDNDGAGVLIYNNGNAIVANCIIRNNNAGDWGGGVNFYYVGNSILRNSLIINNTSDEGAGVYGYDGAIVQNCTIAGNSAISDGGGVKFEGTAPSIINSVIYNNDATDTNHLNYTDLIGTYCCTYPQLSGTGNITNPPGFVDLNNYDFHLLTNSPCVNTGNNQAWMSNSTDLDDNDRIINSTVDMGCYELGGLICCFTADITTGGKPLTVNFTSYVSGTNTESIYYYWDFDNNGVIDEEGLAADSPFYTYTNSGTYTVKLSVKNVYNETADYIREDYIIVADPRYVAYNGKHISPFQNWENAASNIQAAVDISSDGMNIIVSNGFYYQAHQIVLTNAIKIESYAGKHKTFIVSTNSSRAFYLTENASLYGFTFSNCYANNSGQGNNGGAVYCHFGGYVSNCFFVANKADGYGGSVFLLGGGTVIFSSFVSNNATYGGGAALDSGGLILNCIATNNYASYRGGGIYCYNQGKIRSSLVNNNYSGNNGGGIALYRSGGVVESSTISGNSSGNRGGGFYSRDGGSIKNSIVIYNSAAINANSNWYSQITGTEYGRSFTYCNTAPITGLPVGSGNNIDSNPQFLSIANNNFRLQPISPCIDSGINSSWMYNAVDLDGNPRIINIIVNRGAYESSLTPVIIIDAPTTNIVFPFRTINYDFIGRAISIDGNIWFSNSWLGGVSYDFFLSQESWTNNIVLPKYGNYEITFFGTNTLGSITNTTIRVTRKREQIFMFR